MKFNTGKFNVKSNIDFNIPIRLVYSSVLKNVIPTSKVMSFILNLKENTKGSIYLTIGTPFILELSEITNNTSDMVANILTDAFYQTKMKQNTDIVKNMALLIDLSNGLNQESYSGKYMAVHIGEITDKLGLYSILSKDIIYDLFVSSMLNNEVSTVALVNEILNLNINLKPGESIEIDSSNFTIFKDKDDENILHLHKGDWINVGRETVSIDINSGSGGKIEGQLLYVERYL